MENAKNSKEDAKKKQNDIEEIKKTLAASDDSGSKLQEELRTSLEKKEQMSADYHGFFQRQEEISKRCNDLDKEIFRLNNQREKLTEESETQTNYLWTEVLYGKAVEYAGLTGNERVIDAYCGIGTIGIIASAKAKEVIGVELNPDAVRDARINTRENKIQNVQIRQGDAGVFMEAMAEAGEHADVVFMDPPRAGRGEQAHLCHH